MKDNSRRNFFKAVTDDELLELKPKTSKFSFFFRNLDIVRDYQLGMTMAEIGLRFGITKSRVALILDRIMYKLMQQRANNQT